MARAKLKTTDVLGKTDAKQLAELLRRLGRGRDTVLAHITPREAEILKEMGGSGTTNPDTGLPEFEELDSSYPVYDYQQAPDTAAYSGDFYASEPTAAQYDYSPVAAEYTPAAAADLPSYGATEVAGQAGTQGYAVPGVPLPPPRPEEFGGAPGAYEAYAATQPEPTAGAGEEAKPAAADKGYLDKLFGKLDLGTLAKLGLAGGAAMMGRQQQLKAQQQARAVQPEIAGAYGRAAEQLRGLAAPIYGPALTSFAQAQQGALDPARLQQLQIERARLAQSAARTGGVGAIQSAESMERARQQALTAQQEAAVRLLGQANPLLAQAIQSQLSGTTQGLQMSLQLQNQANQAAANLYGQLGKYIAG